MWIIGLDFMLNSSNFATLLNIGQLFESLYFLNHTQGTG